MTARWGDYHLTSPEDSGQAAWTRTDREKTFSLDVAKCRPTLQEQNVPGFPGVRLGFLERRVTLPAASGLPANTRALSIFLINRRQPIDNEFRRDEAYLFQAQLILHSDSGFLGRPDLRGLQNENPSQNDNIEWDDAVADLQYREDREFAVGHNVSTTALVTGSACHTVSTAWIPTYEVERVEPAPLSDLSRDTFRMDVLAAATDAAALSATMLPLVDAYRVWLRAQATVVSSLTNQRSSTAKQLLANAEIAARRIESGIRSLAGDPQALAAFRLANEAMAMAARRRALIEGRAVPESGPAWRPFQLAFFLLNIAGLSDPTHEDRRTVDLLFFPTGGGKTEAYFGLAAFAILLRRLRDPNITGAGLSVLMRYTLRLLTLDQLGRASTLICALEQLRSRDVTLLGKWPFEIGLWVGAASTPNKMGGKGRKDDNEYCARYKTRQYLKGSSSEPPLPFEDCPWCGTNFGKDSFSLTTNGRPDPDNPKELRVRCLSPKCAFKGDNYLPILAVDEMIYRRLPCFLIATVDKFAALPYTGHTGQFFGFVHRYDRDGFYGQMDPDLGQPLPARTGQGYTAPGTRGLLPPDLVIQDELHLISGPLGTMVGLYEAALDGLASYEDPANPQPHRRHSIAPKIVASTATVRRADSQIRALFGRTTVDIFPPPGPDRRDSFFAVTVPSATSPGRLYAGVAAQGRSPKVVQLRVYLSLMAAAQKLYTRFPANAQNPVDPYLTLLGYFNALRELGGTRRLVEDEVFIQLSRRASRQRRTEMESPFANRDIRPNPVELTSRVSAAAVARAKRDLRLPFPDPERVDVALATNMISVGLDITRLGLLVVYGQPKTTAEYIQATSRVGRLAEKPGLVVTILNVHKPRDRSHRERFAFFHQTFYRGVEASGVTPYSPRALDRGLAAVLTSLLRHRIPELTPALGAERLVKVRAQSEAALEALAARVALHDKNLSGPEAEDLANRVRRRAKALLDTWQRAINDNFGKASLEYNEFEYQGNEFLLRDFLHPDLINRAPGDWRMAFRANRSLRDVEPVSNVHLQELDESPEAIQP
ncbi:DISARM system helicase DrmA [Nostoc sp. NIES-2111]